MGGKYWESHSSPIPCIVMYTGYKHHDQKTGQCNLALLLLNAVNSLVKIWQ